MATTTTRINYFVVATKTKQKITKKTGSETCINR